MSLASRISDLAERIGQEVSAMRGEIPTDALDVGAVPKTVHVILALGQSNMEGRGTPTTATTDPVNPRIWQYGATDRELTLASEPLDMVGNSATGIGPSLQFSRRLLRTLPPEDVVLIIPAARGSSPLIGTGVDAWQWGGNPGNLSARSVTQANQAMSAANLQWPKHQVQISSILWVQGERDGEPNAVTRAAYQSALQSLISGYRASFGDERIPFIMGQMVPEGIPVGTRPQINEAHSSVPYSVPFTGFALGPRNMHNGDSSHYSAAGQRQLAASMFSEYERVLAGLAPTVPIQPATLPTRTLTDNRFTQEGVHLLSNPTKAPQTVTIQFEQPFGGVPVVVAQGNVNGPGDWVMAYTANITPTQFVMRTRSGSNLNGTFPMNWIASGPIYEG